MSYQMMPSMGMMPPPMMPSMGMMPPPMPQQQGSSVIVIFLIGALVAIWMFRDHILVRPYLVKAGLVDGFVGDWIMVAPNGDSSAFNISSTYTLSKRGHTDVVQLSKTGATLTGTIDSKPVTLTTDGLVITLADVKLYRRFENKGVWKASDGTVVLSTISGGYTTEDTDGKNIRIYLLKDGKYQNPNSAIVIEVGTDVTIGGVKYTKSA